MEKRKILLPYNFTINDKKALEFIINTFSNQKDVKVTLFHTYFPLPKLDLDANPEMQKMKGGLTFLSAELREKETGLKSARDYLIERGFADDQVAYIFRERRKSIAVEIIESTSEGKYNIIVLSRQPGKISRMFARSVHDKVLSMLKDVTVCIAS